MSSGAGKPPAFSRTELAELMMPHHANILGKVFGGVILGLIDKAAGAAAMRHAGRSCVTAQIDQVTFRAPVEIGEMVRFQATVTYVGRTSMEIEVCVLALNVRTSTERLTNTSYVTMVAIDENARPTPLPPLLPQTAEEKKRYEEGRLRMEERRTRRAKGQGV